MTQAGKQLSRGAGPGRDTRDVGPCLTQVCRGSYGSSCCQLAGVPTPSMSVYRCCASLARRVVGQECAVEAGVRVLHQFYQKCFIEFKQAGELLKQLMYRIKPLEEHRTLFILVLCIFLMATAISKLVPKIQPIRLH